MSERPIIFSSESVQAILDGRKTMTRRIDSPYYRNWKVGDLLWVREKWRMEKSLDDKKPSQFIGWSVNYTDEYVKHLGFNDFKQWGRWRSPRFMPKWAARIWFEVTAIRKERLQEINEKDAKAEGMMLITTYRTETPYTDMFRHWWNILNAKRGYGWDTNPEVKVISFKKANR